MLARWLSRQDNPLSTRVIVNRIWQHHFGRGLAGTPSDFGRLGDPPSHPELLDWLAQEFVRQGWRLKPMHRLILTSAAYRQSASRSPRELATATRVDPENRLLWKQTVRRLAAEEIRDAMLFSSGELVTSIGGPSVLGSQPRRPSTLGSSAIRPMSCWMPLIRPAATPRLRAETPRPPPPRHFCSLTVDGCSPGQKRSPNAWSNSSVPRRAHWNESRWLIGWPLAVVLYTKRARRLSGFWAGRHVRWERHPISRTLRLTTRRSWISVMCS